MDKKRDIFPATVFYDGDCPVCSREIRFYRRKARAGALEYVDISTDDFEARRYSLNPERVDEELHVLLADGSARVGVEAFQVIWRATPGFGWLAWFVGLPVIRSIAGLGYRLFAANRYRLTGRCSTGESRKACER